MKVSDIRSDAVKDYCGISDEESDGILAVVMSAARAFIRTYTGLTDAEIDEKEEIGTAYMALVNDMISNREYSGPSTKNINPCVKLLLDMNSVNGVG